MKPKEEFAHILEIIKQKEKDLVSSMVQAWVYQREVNQPTNIGLIQAQQNLDQHRKHEMYLKDQIDLLKNYAWEVLGMDVKTGKKI